MPRRRKNRLWSAEEKRAICQQTRAPGVSVAQVARRYALNANLIFKWLKDPRFAPAAVEAAAPAFLPVAVHDEGACASRLAAPASGAEARVEIVLAAGHRVTIEGPFDGAAVARLLMVLAQP